MITQRDIQLEMTRTLERIEERLHAMECRLTALERMSTRLDGIHNRLHELATTYWTDRTTLFDSVGIPRIQFDPEKPKGTRKKKATRR